MLVPATTPDKPTTCAESPAELLRTGRLGATLITTARLAAAHHRIRAVSAPDAERGAAIAQGGAR